MARSPEHHRSSRDERYSSSRYEGSSSTLPRRPDESRSGRHDDRDDRDRERRDRYSRDDRDRHRDDERDRPRDSDRHRERDRDYDRDRSDRHRERDRDRDRRDDRYRRDERPDDRRRTEESSRRDRRPSPPAGQASSRRRTPSPAARPLPGGSASPAPRDDGPSKPKTAKERLAEWRRQRGLDKDGGNATPEPADKKPAVASPVPSALTPKAGKATLPSKPAPKPVGDLKFGAMSTIGLPAKPVVGVKRALTQLDDEETSDRKFQKLDLPEVDMKVETGEVVTNDMVGDDLAAEAVDEDEVKSEVEEKMDVDKKEEEVEEEDELDAFMRQNDSEVLKVNTTDAKRMGLLDLEDETEDREVNNKAEDELSKAEALLQLAASKSRKKDLPTPDHASIKYEPFRKAFYSAPVETLEMTEEETELLRLEMDGIKIRGVDAPKPVKNWGAFGIPTACLDLIRRNEWATPTSIQAQAIPAIMSGRDVIGIAKTGSGKTIAFLLPLFRHVKDQRPIGGGEGPIAIILGPTRELAMQIYREAKPFMAAMNLKVSCCVGGQSISEDIAALKKGAEVVVCTPGRMIDLLTANSGRVTNCRRCTFLVLDEADRMFDMGFEPQVMKIINNTRPEAQKVLFSATFPKSMEGLARKILVKPLEITVGGRSVVAAEIDQRVEIRDQDTKWNRLLEILGELNMEEKEGEESRTLIFVDRQESADDLFGALNKAGYLASSLHGGREQVDRDQAIKDFKSGAMPIIVATSVAARGLDVKELKLVINYDAPNHLEDYVHRAGRTGRAGNKGTCITFLSPEQDRFAVDITRALEASNAYVPPELKNMSDEFLSKIKSGTARSAGSGFRGKGLERLERKREEKDRTEKSTYGDTSEALSLSSREGAVIPYKPKTTEFKPPDNSMKGDSDYTFTQIDVEIIHGPAPDRSNNPLLWAASGTGKNATTAVLPKQTIDAFDKARAAGKTMDAKNFANLVARLVQKIDDKKVAHAGIAALEGAAARKSKDPDATDWHAIFPINDYPQKARWKVTNKEQMSILVENTNASITMRGVFYGPGEEPKPGGEPKLHLLIESNDKARVQEAVDTIRRTLIEGSMEALNNADRSIGGGGGAGRYSV